HPLFDSAYYRRQCDAPIPPSVSPLEHYLQRGRRLSPHPLFDPNYYLAHARDSASAPGTLLEHYLANWQAMRCGTHVLLDVNAYLDRYPAVLATGNDPLSHFILSGAEAGYNPHPLFD